MKKININLAAGMALLLGTSLATAALEEVIVTATKRAQSIQDVPVSVAAVSAEMMEKIGITDVEDLTSVIPNFEINSSAIIPNLYIRGLGGGTTHSIEQSVGRFIDDVYISRGVINLHPFLDVASVEVLRGPQGTLFGKNTAAGAMIVRTNDPTDEFEAGLNLSYGDYDTTGNVTEINGYVSGSLSDRVSARLAFIYKDREGYYENILNGPDGAQREDYGVIGKLKFDISDSTTANLKLQYMEYESFGSDTAEATFGGPPIGAWEGWAIASGVDPAAISGRLEGINGLDWKVAYNCDDALSLPINGSVPIGSFCPGRDMDSTNVTFDVEHEADAGSVKFILAYQDYAYDHRFQALDMGLANMFRGFRAEQYEGISTELRFTSEESDSFDYIAGVYYEDSEIDRQQESDRNFFFAPIFERQHEPWSQTTETFAVFGQARVFFTDQITGIFGGRWSTETKDFQFESFFTPYGTDIGPIIPGVNLRKESREESRFTPSATIQFEVNDDVNLFATISRGHKTGGFSDRVEGQDTDIQFDAEIIDGVEFGMKANLLDDAISLNVTFFHMDVEGLQLSTIVAGTANTFVVDNAADSISQGYEVEFNWAVNDNWIVGANYAYTDATYKDFVGLDSCAPQFLNDAGVCDLGGETLQYAPNNKASAYIDYFAEDTFNGWDFGARVDVSYTDDQYTDVSLAEFALTPAHEIVGASLRLVSPDDKVTLSLIGRNLANEKVNAWSVGAGPNSLSTMAPPRFLTAKVAWKY